MKRNLVRIVLFLFAVQPMVFGQKIDSYMADMREALEPYGAMAGNDCHALEIDVNGPWGHYALPDGIGKDGEFTWAVLKMDTHRVFLDLADLDEDKISNNGVFSLEYISKHHSSNSKWVADTPTVVLHAKGLKRITVHQVNLEKLASLRGQPNVPEEKLGLNIDQKQSVFILFSDQQHADYFQKAIQKAIVLCKAQ
jgi:hypothetical protein